ncbi:MAG: ester cyclase [Nitrososphaera sp.]
MPDFQTSIHDMVAEGDLVALRISWSGTHRGELMGIPPTGKHVNVTEMQFCRISNGKIAERWVEADLSGMLRQMGLVAANNQK